MGAVPDLVIVDGEMRHATSELEQEFTRIPITLVLHDRILHCLLREVVLQFEGEDELFVRATQNSDTDNSSYIREVSGGGDYVWFSRPDENAVRLALAMPDGVDEIASVKSSLTVSPNPFNESTVIKYTLDNSSTISYRLYDINGRLVNEEKIGNQNAGNHQIEINGSSLDAGVYYFTLRVGNSAVTEKLIVTK